MIELRFARDLKIGDVLTMGGGNGLSFTPFTLWTVTPVGASGPDAGGATPTGGPSVSYFSVVGLEATVASADGVSTSQISLTTALFVDGDEWPAEGSRETTLLGALDLVAVFVGDVPSLISPNFIQN